MKNVIQIIHYSEEYKESLKTLNYNWLQKYFHVEKSDEISLSNSKKEIIDKGGYIFYVKLNGVIIGTASLIRKSDSIFELSKMAVTDEFQGFGIGKILMDYCLKFAQEKKVEKLILYSNTKLEAAIYLFRKYGFYEIELENGLYERANIKLELKL